MLAEKQIGVSTPFHLMAPIYTPVPIVYRMFGLNNAAQFEMLTELFRGIGFRNGLLVQGSDHLDEATVAGPSRVRGYRNGEDFDFQLTPESAGLPSAPVGAIVATDARSNTRDFLRIVHGLETGPKRDLVALNAGLALWISERAGHDRGRGPRGPPAAGERRGPREAPPARRADRGPGGPARGGTGALGEGLGVFGRDRSWGPAGDAAISPAFQGRAGRPPASQSPGGAAEFRESPVAPSGLVDFLGCPLPGRQAGLMAVSPAGPQGPLLEH